MSPLSTITTKRQTSKRVVVARYRKRNDPRVYLGYHLVTLAQSNQKHGLQGCLYEKRISVNALDRASGGNKHRHGVKDGNKARALLNHSIDWRQVPRRNKVRWPLLISRWVITYIGMRTDEITCFNHALTLSQNKQKETNVERNFTFNWQWGVISTPN